jgi:hypothetical protein
VDDQIRTSTTSVADYFAAKMRARREGATTTPPTATFQATAAEPVPGLDAEGTVLVDEVVAGKRTKDRKRKRNDADAVEKERAKVHDGDADPQGERKGKRKKRKAG